tara:strand:+ start:1858 stop:2217 length:360 start_codon:yes stop_codon:yes gene_type:complete
MMNNLLSHKILLLENIGRKTSIIYQTPLLYIKYNGPDFLIVGSFGGHNNHPAWFLNIKDNKKAHIIIKGKRIEVALEILSCKEKETAWNELIKSYPGFSDYQNRTTRSIPVIKFTPVSN